MAQGVPVQQAFWATDGDICGPPASVGRVACRYPTDALGRVAADDGGLCRLSLPELEPGRVG